MGDGEVLTEVPATLKRLVRYITRGFYSVEHAIVVDMLVHYPCIKEDDLCELIKFERKAVRGLINTLKMDKFVKSKVRIETSTDGRQSHHSYYFINYSSFVNVVKYKLDHIRKKIEMEERETTSRASFKCPNCTKTYTDLEADQLFDMVTVKFLCMYCQHEVEEEASAAPRQDARTLMVKFNEQMEPLFGLLREVEDIKLAPSILEPEPVDIKHPRDQRTGGSNSGKRDGVWSGDSTKNLDYGDTENQITIQLESQADRSQQVQEQLIKERPIWMVKSTVEGASNDNTSMSETATKPGTSKEPSAAANIGNDDIMKTLLAHETKSRREKIPGFPSGPGGAGGSDEDTTSSESEDEYAKPSNTLVVPAATTISQDVGGGEVEEMDDDDDEEEEATVMIGGTKVPYHEVTEDMVAKMTPAEKEQYIKIGQEMYQDMYE